MVSTRHHPRPFPDPPSASTSSSPRKTSTPPSPTVEVPTPKRTPARRSTRKSTSNAASEEHTTTSSLTRTKSSRRAKSSSVAQTYTHHPSSLLITWLVGSLPLIFWDTAYVLLRPHTMPGGRFHSPIWTPYALYGTIDYMYGWPQWNSGNGFTAAQGSLNAVEAAMYIYYLVVVFRGVEDGWRTGVIDKLWREKTNGRVSVQGSNVATAVVICFAGAVMTVSKTVLYWLNEAFSNFDNIGHNNLSNLFWLWIVPNGLWLIFPTVMIYELGQELTSAMHLAGRSEEKEE